MKKLLKRTLIFFVILLVGVMIYLWIFFLPVMVGMAAKTVCSCVYVAERPMEDIKKNELQVFPGLSSASFEVKDSSVVASLLGRSMKAIYRNGLGCTLLSEQPEDVVRKQTFVLPIPPRINQDTILWPSGNRNADTLVAGVNYERINQLLDSAFIDVDPTKPLNTYAVVVVYDGKIIGEKYAEGLNRNSKLMGWSMAKSITNAMVGVLVRDGKLSLTDCPVEEWKNDDRANIKLENLLQANSGLDWNESYFNPHSQLHKMLMFSDDKGGYSLNQKAKEKPGEFFEYSSATTNILCKIVRRQVGDSAYYKFPYERIFYKTGMNNMVIEPDASGTFVGSSYAWGTARDWARFGLLYLNDGYWNGERLLPEGWVEFTSTPSKAPKRGEYGAQWWLNAGEKDNPSHRMYPLLPADAYWADGFEEQYVMVIPSENLVIVRMGASHHGSPFEKMAKGIIDCLNLDSSD